MKGWTLLLVLGTVLALGANARAQGDFRSRDAGFIGKDIPLLEIDDCRPQAETDPDKLRKLGSEHFQRGEVLYVQGDYQGAIEHYEQANANNIYTRYHLGLAHDGAGHASQAEEIFQYVFENNFNSIGYALVRSEAEQRLSRS